MVVDVGRLNVPFAVPVVNTDAGAVPVSALAILKVMSAFHWAKSVIAPVVDFQFVVPKL